MCRKAKACDVLWHKRDGRFGQGETEAGNPPRERPANAKRGERGPLSRTRPARPKAMLQSAAARAAALDLASQQPAADRAEQRAERAIPARINRAASQRADARTHQQAGGAIIAAAAPPPAIIAPIGIAPAIPATIIVPVAVTPAPAAAVTPVIIIVPVGKRQNRRGRMVSGGKGRGRQDGQFGSLCRRGKGQHRAGCGNQGKVFHVEFPSGGSSQGATPFLFILVEQGMNNFVGKESGSKNAYAKA